MPKFVVLSKNSILLALLAFSFFTNPQMQPSAPRASIPLEQGIQCLALSKVSNDSGGFSGDTLVKTPAGYEKTSDLKVGTMVSTFNEATESFCEQPVIAVSTTLATKTLLLTLSDEERTTIYTGTQQSFYSYNPCTEISNLQKYAWLKSLELQNSSLFTSGGICSVQDICESSKLTKLYLIEVAETHNFFVTKADILVHNSPFAIPAITKIATETTMLIAAGAKMVVNAVTGKNKYASETTSETESQTPKKPTYKETTAPINPEDGTTSSGGSPGGPNKPPKKDKKESKVKCEGKCDNKGCSETKKALRSQAKEASKRADQAAEQAQNADEKAKSTQSLKTKIAIAAVVLPTIIGISDQTKGWLEYHNNKEVLELTQKLATEKARADEAERKIAEKELTEKQLRKSSAEKDAKIKKLKELISTLEKERFE